MANIKQDDIIFTNEVLDAIKNGRKIQAIKLLRQERGLDLKDAKEAIEAYVENNAEIKEAFDANKTSGFTQETILKIVILLIIFLLVYSWV